MGKLSQKNSNHQHEELCAAGEGGREKETSVMWADQKPYSPKPI